MSNCAMEKRDTRRNVAHGDDLASGEAVTVAVVPASVGREAGRKRRVRSTGISADDEPIVAAIARPPGTNAPASVEGSRLQPCVHVCKEMYSVKNHFSRD